MICQKHLAMEGIAWNSRESRSQLAFFFFFSKSFFSFFCSSKTSNSRSYITQRVAAYIHKTRFEGAGGRETLSAKTNIPASKWNYPVSRDECTYCRYGYILPLFHRYYLAVENNNNNMLKSKISCPPNRNSSVRKGLALSLLGKLI